MTKSSGTWGWKGLRSLALEFPPGELAEPAPENRARLRFNSLFRRFEYSFDEAAYIPLGEGEGITQDAWYVDSVSGSDANSGANAGEALKTLAELDRRLGAGTIEQPTLITLAGDFSSEVLVLRCNSGFGGASGILPLGIEGVTTQLATGTITATANQTIGDPSPPQLTDPGVADWTPYLTKRLRITAAPNNPSDVGKIVWLKRDDGAGAVTTSYAVEHLDPLNDQSLPSADLSGLPLPPYDYVVEDLVPVAAILHAPTVLTRVNVCNVALDTGTDTTTEALGGFFSNLLVLSGCNIEGQIVTSGFPAFWGCRATGPDLFGTGAFLVSCLIDDGPLSSSARQLFLAGGTMAIENSLYLGSPFGASSSFAGLIAGGAACYDSPGPGVVLELGTTMHAFGGLIAGSLSGTGNLTGCDVGTNSTFSYDTFKSAPPTITGATEVVVGSAATTWAAIDAAGGQIETVPPTLARVVKV